MLIFFLCYFISLYNIIIYIFYPTVYFFIVANGCRYVLVKTPSLPNSVDVRIVDEDGSMLYFRKDMHFIRNIQIFCVIYGDVGFAAAVMPAEYIDSFHIKACFSGSCPWPSWAARL